VAAILETIGMRAQVVPPEVVQHLVGRVRLALVASTVPDLGAVVSELSRNGCRVIVYGALDQPMHAVAADAGAVGFVSEDGGEDDLERAVDVAVRGTAESGQPAGYLGAAADRFDQLGFAELTRREREVLDGLVAGLRPADIARRDFVSVVTVRNQVQSVLTKLNVHSQIEAVAAARWSGWSPSIRPEDPSLRAAIDASAS
jgi:DNA-binding NarL/FixJ family response regulator